MGTSAEFADRRDTDVGDSLFLRTREVNPSCLVYYLNAATAPGQKAIRGQGDRLVFIRVIALSAVEVSSKCIAQRTLVADLSGMGVATVVLDSSFRKLVMSGRVRCRNCSRGGHD